METPPALPKRRRWPLVLLGAAVLLGLLLLLGPRLAAPFVRGKVVSTLESTYGVEVRLDDLGFGLPAWGRVGGFEIADRSGQRLAAMGSVDARARFLPLLSGAVDAEVRIAGVELHLRQDGEGRWNFEDFAPDAEDTPEPDEDGGAMPDVALDFELRDTRVVLHAAAGETELRDLELDLRVDGLDRPGSYRLAGNVVGPNGPAGTIRGEGVWTLVADATGSQGGLALTIEGLLMRALEPVFDLVLEERPSALADPAVLDGAVDFTFRADVADGLDSIAVTTFELRSPLLAGELRGTVSGLAGLASEGEGESALTLAGLAGEFRYVPDRIAPLVAAFLPANAVFGGSEEELLRFELDGPLDPSAPPAELLHGVDAEFSIGLGQLSTQGLETGGTVTLGVHGDVARFGADLGANGGGIQLSARADLGGAERSVGLDGDAPAAPLALEVRWDAVEACAAFMPLLSKLHPAFASVESVTGASFEGLLSGELQLSYEAPFSLEKLLAGELPSLAPLVAAGEVGIRKARLEGSPFASQLLTQLGSSGASREIEFEPIAFHVKAEELTYDRAWQWTIDGTRTVFTGAFGFDQSIDMIWKVPIGDALIRRFGELEPLRGKSMKVPIGGTVTRPTIGLVDAAEALVRGALEARAQQEVDALKEKAKDKLDDALDDALGGDAGTLLEQVLGGKGTSTSGEDPGALLKQADALWKSDKKAEAAKIYRRIRAEHKYSGVYLLNKKRIKERAGHS